MRIRQEQEPDYPEIYQMVQTAFATAKVKDGDEQGFVNTLRAGQEEGIVGHGMLATMQKHGMVILSLGRPWGIKTVCAGRTTQQCQQK